MLFAVSSSDEGGAITDIVLTPLASLTPLALTPADAACATDFVPTSLISSTASLSLKKCKYFSKIDKRKLSVY